MIRYLPMIVLAGIALEIASLIWVGAVVGFVPALLLLLAGGFIGTSLFRSAGFGVMEMLHSPVQNDTFRKEWASTAMLRAIAGILFLIPGFFSDFIAVLLLLPPTRKWLAAKIKLSSFSGMPTEPNRYGKVIDAEAIEITGEIEQPFRTEPEP